MQKTKIPWTEYTWNPSVGCPLPLVSSGCKNCYARELHNMRHKAYLAGSTGLPKQYAKPFEKIQLFPDRLEDPLKLKKPAKIFVGSMTDLFGKDVTWGFIEKVMATIEECPQHDFYILTKRPHFMAEYFNSLGKRYELSNCPNVHLGVTICNQKEMDEKGPIHRSVPAAYHFWSLEPLLGSIHNINFEGINLVIVGGESGPNARPMHPDWVRSIRDQCVAAGVPFFFKQWGEWLSGADKFALKINTYQGYYPKRVTRIGNTTFFRVGKKKAGCILDGKEWKQGFARTPPAAKQS